MKALLMILTVGIIQLYPQRSVSAEEVIPPGEPQLIEPTAATKLEPPTSDVVAANKEEFESAVKSKITRWEEIVTDLKDRASTTAAKETKKDLNATRAYLEKRIREIDSELKRVAKVTENKASSIESRIRGHLASMKNRYDKVSAE